MAPLAHVAVVRVALIRVAVVIGVLSTPHATWADASSETRVVALLSDYESLPDARVFVERGEPMAATLFQIYAAGTRPTFVRLRALRVLSFFPAIVATERLRRVIADPNAKPVFVREAALGLVRCDTDGDTTLVAQLLKHNDPDIRRAAVHALQAAGTAQARSQLVVHRAHEPDTRVRVALDAALDAAATR